MFVDLITRGKKNNHITHHYFLRYIMDQYKQKDEINMSNTIELFIPIIVERNISVGRILDINLPIQQLIVVPTHISSPISIISRENGIVLVN